jgi:hypothetical protein
LEEGELENFGISKELQLKCDACAYANDFFSLVKIKFTQPV